MSTDTSTDLIEKVIVKFYAAEPLSDLRTAIDVYHGWIQNKTVPGMLIDVADYAHVPSGPGIMLIGHEADHAIDEAEGPQGYLYSRKRGLSGDNVQRLTTVLADAAHAAQVFTDSGLGCRFDPRRVRAVFNDRLATPNDDATWAWVEPLMTEVAQAVFGTDSLVVERESNDPRQRLTVHVAVDAKVDFSDLASHAGASAS